MAKKKTQKSAEAVDPSLQTKEPSPHEKSEVELDIEAEHRMQAESPALPEGAEAEAEAADSLEAAHRPAAHESAEDHGNTEAGGTAESELTAGAEDESTEDDADEDEAEPAFTPRPGPPAKLERLQKILAQAGVASRRRAEELIEQGRVQVNGKVITELGTKADSGRDHVRVDGKLLHGAERLRYFVLNKPRGYVTTVKDPEGRPTVMQFFEKMPERLYPVGRLDYLTEGLLVVTNDGDLANKLTKAASGVEKTYLVKVAGQPSEAELDILRAGVAIEKGKPGEGRVRTAPARIRQVRQGDNPWYEVVLIEGRNRELRKMFEEIGHFVEKIRRVGYGPLILDQEPGNLRELDTDELDALRKAADGKLRTPKSKDVRRRNAVDAGKLPTVLPRPSSRPRIAPPNLQDSPGAPRSADFPARKTFGPAGDRGPRLTRASAEGFRPSTGSTGAPPRRVDAGKSAPGNFESGRAGQDRFAARKAAPARSAPGRFGPAKPAWKKDDRPARPSFNAAEGDGDRRSSYRGGQNTSAPGEAGRGRTSAGRSFGAKPAWNKTGGSDRPSYQRPSGPRRSAPPPPPEAIEKRSPRLHIEAIEPDRRETRPPRSSSAPPRFNRGTFDRPASDRPRAEAPSPIRGASNRPREDRPRAAKPAFGKPRFEKSRFDRPQSGATGRFRPADRDGSGSGRSAAPRAAGPARPPRGEGLSRPFTTSSGIPRPGGARPSSKPGKPAGRSFGPRSGSGSSSKAGSTSRPAGKSGWKPKSGFGGGKPPAGAKSRSSGAHGGGGAGKSPTRPGGKRPGSSGGKRY